MQLLKEQKGKIPHTNADKLLACKHTIYIITALSKYYAFIKRVEHNTFQHVFDMAQS